MIIREFDVTACTMRKEDPTWRFALAASPVTDGHVVRIATEDGDRGLRLCLRDPAHGLDRGHARGRARTVPPAGDRRDPRDIEAILGAARPRAARRAAGQGGDRLRAARSRMARALDVPLNVLFGGKVRDQLPILRILAIKTPPEMAAAAQKLVDKGYRYLKIKVHGDVEEDVARVARDPQAGRRRRASHHRRQPVLHAQGRDRRAQPHGGVSHRSVRAAGRMPTISRAWRWSPARCR